MGHTGEDRRVRRTKARLRQALTGLLAQKDVKEITVKELTELADVNRGTFYCHYQDIYDMIAQVEDALFEELTGVLNAYSASDLRAGLGPILGDVLRFVGENADLCAALLSSRRMDGAFFQRLYALVYEKGVQEWGEVYALQASPLGDYYMNFLVSGVLGLVRTWVSTGRRETPEEMAGVAERLIRFGIHSMQRAGPEARP